MRLYIDPGTGSMLFAMAVGIVGLAGYFLKELWIRARFFLSGGKRTDVEGESIPFVIFSDDKRYWPVFEPICRELDARGFNVVYMTASPDDPALHNQYARVNAEFIGEGNKAFMKLNFLKATMLLSTTPGLDVYQWKRSKEVKYYIHIPHMPGELTTYRMFGIDYYDALLLSGQYQIEDTRALEKLRNLPNKECRIVGIPYLDEKAKMLEAAASEPQGAAHDRTVLVAPSWGENSLLNRFGNRLIDRLIQTGYHIIVRPHPQSFTSEKELIARLMLDYPDLEWNRDTDNFDVLNRSDIMISDFSGVIFDFALVFDKPVICAYTDFDKDPYDAWWLETPIWTATSIPRIGPILSEASLSDIKEMIDAALEDKSFEEGRHEVRDETWAYRGEGARLAADYILEKYQELIAEPAEVTESEDHVGCAVARETDQEHELSLGESQEETTPVVNRRVERRRYKIAALIGMALLVLGTTVGVRSYLTTFTEAEYERGDLELMRMAEATARIRLKKKSVHETSSYWLNGKTLALIPVANEKPKPYGLGTDLVGGASEEYYAEYPDSPRYRYDEGEDYTNRILMVTIDPDSEEVSCEWVDCE